MITLFDFIVLRMETSFVRVSQHVVACFVSKLKELGNCPKSNEETARYIFIVLKHFRECKTTNNQSHKNKFSNFKVDSKYGD